MPDWAWLLIALWPAAVGLIALVICTAVDNFHDAEWERNKPLPGELGSR